jgi:hypothetical protein
MPHEVICCDNCFWQDEDECIHAGETYCRNLDRDVYKHHRCWRWMNDKGENASMVLMRKHNRGSDGTNDI